MSRRKTGSARQDQAIALKVSGLTYAAIGQVLGVSRQRAQQLIRPPYEIYRVVRRRAGAKCEDCGTETMNGHMHHMELIEVAAFNDIANLSYLCIGCHRKHHSKCRG